GWLLAWTFRKRSMRPVLSVLSSPCMPAEKPSSFVNVDELMPRITLEQVVAFYGVTLPELRQVGSETRSRCFLACGRQCETGDRALAIQTGHEAKQWVCHQQSCGKGGNLVSLCDLLKPGANAGGRPRGQRFKEIAADLKAIVEGKTPTEGDGAPAPTQTIVPPPVGNRPLK